MTFEAHGDKLWAFADNVRIEMKLALFTQHDFNLPRTYVWEGQVVETNAGMAVCQPFSREKQDLVKKIVVVYKLDPDGGYDEAWEADIVAVTRSAQPYDTVANAPRFDIFYANAVRLPKAPERSHGPGFIRYID